MYRCHRVTHCHLIKALSEKPSWMRRPDQGEWRKGDKQIRCRTFLDGVVKRSECWHTKVTVYPFLLFGKHLNGEVSSLLHLEPSLNSSRLVNCFFFFSCFGLPAVLRGDSWDSICRAEEEELVDTQVTKCIINIIHRRPELSSCTVINMLLLLNHKTLQTTFANF